MEITCETCQTKIRIPDEKIPPGRAVSLKCPRCKGKITLDTEAMTPGVDEIDVEPGYDAEDKPFDFVEEEGKTALICENDSEIRRSVAEVLEIMEYHISVAENARDALKKMRYHTYDMVVVNELFDTSGTELNGVLIYLERLPMVTRRNMFVAMISAKHRTFDNMMAFNKSVNLIVNIRNISDIGKILSRGITDNDYFYRTFKTVLKNVGIE